MNKIDKLKEKLKRLQRCKCDCEKCKGAKKEVESHAEFMDVTVEFFIDSGIGGEKQVNHSISQHCLELKCCPHSPPSGDDDGSGPHHHPYGDNDVFGLKR